MKKIYIKNFLGKINKQKKLIMLSESPLVSRFYRGWIKQEINAINNKSKNRRGYIKKNIRNPPGIELAHERGREKAKGYGYEHTQLQLISNHRLQHIFDNYGKKNKERDHYYSI